jgi:hypothetical protein
MTTPTTNVHYKGANYWNNSTGRGIIHCAGYYPLRGVLFNYVLMTYTVLIHACMYTKTPIACFLFRLKNPDTKTPHTCMVVIVYMYFPATWWLSSTLLIHALASGKLIPNPGDNPDPARKFEFQPRKDNPGTRNQLVCNPGTAQ